MRASSARPAGVAITSVSPGSLAWSAGVRPGHRILRVGPRDVEDALAVTFAMAAPAASVLVDTPSGPREIPLCDPDTFLAGLELEPIEPMACTNNCVYCFCRQNPPGARPRLRFRDEDFRLSFLCGTYLTLSSISPEHLQRIVADRLSPLYVTVPATDEDVRRTLLGVPHALPLLPTLRFLADHGICLHAQVVVCPGLNDGQVLERTLRDLAQMRPAVRSVALVPVGTTRYTPDPRVRRPTRSELEELVALAARWRLGEPGGAAWAQVADEVWLVLNKPVPGRAWYGDAPQRASGVGMVRRFLDDAHRLRRWRRPPWWGVPLFLVTGELFAPLLSTLVGDLTRRWGPGVRVVSVTNRVFGPSVTVAGLLGGREVAEALRHVEAGVVVLPSDALSLDDTFVDDEPASLLTAGSRALVRAELLTQALREVGRLLPSRCRSSSQAA